MPPIPPITRNLIIACVVLYLLTGLVGASLRPEQWLALWPVSTGWFLPWQLITYALLHAGVEHLAFNMLGLWMFGSELEHYWGPRRYLQFLAASIVAAGLAQLGVTALLGSSVPTLGISGGVYGLLIAYALAFPRRQFDLIGFLPMVLMAIPGLYLFGIVLYVVMLTRRDLVPIAPIHVPALTMVAIFGGISLLLGLLGSGGVAHFAHLGGMLGGWLMLRYWRSSGGRRR